MKRYQKNILRLLRFSINGFAFGVLCENFVNNPDYTGDSKDRYQQDRALGGLASVFTLIGGLMPVILFLSEFMGVKNVGEFRMVANIRNLLTTGALVSLGIMVGLLESEDYVYDWILAGFISVGVMRFVDLLLDTDGFKGTWAPCIDDSAIGAMVKRLKKDMKEYKVDPENPATTANVKVVKYISDKLEKAKMRHKQVLYVKNLLAFATFAVVIVTISVYMTLGDNVYDMDRLEDAYLLAVLCLTAVHLMLVIVWLASYVSKKAVCGACCNMLKAKGKCKDEDKIKDKETPWTWNQIPLVTKAVFTSNLILLSLSIGQKMDDMTRIGWLVWAITTLTLTDVVVRNEV